MSRLECPAEPAQLPALLALVTDLCQRERIDDATCHDLQLIVEEACVNVMHHAYPAGQAGPLALEARVVQDSVSRRIVLTLEDQGRPFDPMSVAPPDTTAAAEARAPGGLGVHLIRQLSHRQRYQRHPRLGNVFTIEKNLVPTAPHRPLESPLQITLTPHDTIAVLAITGSIDSLNADELAQRFAQAMDQGHVRLVADFSLVNYTSSAGLRSLLGAVKSCRLAGGDLRVAAVQPQVNRVLEIAGFTSILNIFPDVRHAVDSFKEAA